MAGAIEGRFPQRLSPFLRGKLRGLRQGPADEPALRAIELQYLRDPREDEAGSSGVRRHYEAEVGPLFEGRRLRGIERLYRRSVVIEPTMVCAAHCRWCIRGQYPVFHLAEDELVAIGRYLGSAPENEELREALVTGGDPFTDACQLEVLLTALARHAPRIELIRVATRVPLQQPRLVDRHLLELLAAHRDRLEIGLHVNHAVELFPEVVAAIEALRATGARLYNQTVLLRGLNDSLPVLAELAEALRALRIEWHYLFHCVPMRGMRHHRTTVDEGLALAGGLSSSGLFSGRVKPRFVLMTDVGKISPYEGTILAREDGRLLLGSHYDADERRRWNPGWHLPASAEVGSDGRLRVWYEDGVRA